MDIADLLLTSSSGSGLARLVRASMTFVDNPSGDELKLAVRVVVEQLFRKDAPTKSRMLVFGAHELRRARQHRKLTSGEALFIDFALAACLARTGHEAEAASIIAAARQQLQTTLIHRWDEIGRLSMSSDPADRVRCDALREEVLVMEESFEAIVGELVPQAPPPVAPQKVRERHLVMLVDDDDDVREAIGTLLEDEGVRVVGAENGARAKELLDQGVLPGAIILDLMMPVMSGWDFYRWQQSSRFSSTPTLVYTATGLRQGSLGPAKIIPKTVGANELVQAVTLALAS